MSEVKIAYENSRRESYTTLLGLLVLIGWHTRSIGLIQVDPSFAPMQYNTALAFVLSGMGLFALLWAYRRLATMCGGLTAAIGLLTLLQYLFLVDLGLDSALMEPYITVGTSHPGRMAPNTAVCFALSGVAVLAMSRLLRLRLPQSSTGILGAVVCALGLVAFLGYLGGVETAYGWGHLTRMAVHTALGFLLLGTGIMRFVWSEDTSISSVMPHWVPITAGIGMMALAVGLMQALSTLETARMQHTVTLGAQTVRGEINKLLGLHVLNLRRMAKRWEGQRRPPRSTWEAEAQEYIAHQPGYQTIAWVDEAFRQRWIVPLSEPSPPVQGTFGVDEAHLLALAAARDQRTVLVTRTVDLIPGGKGFAVYVPLFFDEDFDGFLRGVFRLQPLLDTVLSDNVSLGYGVALYDGADEIYRGTEPGRVYDTAWAQEVPIAFYGLTWRLQVWPRVGLLAVTPYLLPKVVLVVGLIMAILLAVSAHITRKIHVREHELQVLNDTLEQRVIDRTCDLQAEVTERLRVEEQRQVQTREIVSGAQVLAASVSQISVAVSQLTAGATDMASAVRQTSSTTAEVRHTAEFASRKAQQVAAVAEKTVQVAHTGQTAVQASMTGMQEIQTQMATIIESIVRLSEQSQAIGAIIATVNDLADQSNLLAVNAAIEAAKAGEHGQGFTVVAQEIKSLAEQSKQATVHVRSILADIQRATRAAVRAIDQGRYAVETGGQQATEAGETIELLQVSIHEAAQAATQIAASSQQQLIGAEQVAEAMQSIRQASMQTLDSMRQLEATVEELNALGQRLGRLTDDYVMVKEQSV